VAGRHLPALLAALHEVGERAPFWRPVGGNVWRVAPTGDGGLTLTGPVILHGVVEGAADDLPARAIEVEYRHLWSLRVTIGDHP
jgi:hypothetical protein